ncbi:MFS transporter [Rhizobium leguminosarum]|uniref:MFS transporter n=1 Tax=Rhizobium leguminosarum TaxID=384 RepID=UPI00103F7E1B|nr:MFS transporter [Rhizobium leguminosarum]TBY50138.1 MFS transporter [Rhizobium leguminosarum bv. viciae]
MPVFHSVRHIRAHPQLLLLAFMIFVQGSAYGSTLPYLSITAIRELGMSDQAYSVLVFVTSASAVTISVSLGILSDLIGDRRRIMIAMALMGVAGYGAIFFFPSVPVFIVATAFVIPFFQSVSSLIFVGVRAETATLPGREAAAINATVRAFMSASWVIIPAAMGLAFAGSASMMGAWGVAGLCALFIFLCSAFLLAKPAGDGAAAKSQTGFFAALGELATPVMLARMVSMAALTGTIRLSSTLWPLILIADLGDKTADVGVIAGLIALLEIPFMLIWASLLKRLDIVPILAIAGLIYAGFLAALTFATSPWQIYALTVPAAAGAAALLSMLLTYFQDLFPGRPGLGTSFNPINSFLGNGLTALTFATGAHYLGYSGTAWLGLALALAGISGLILLEKRRPAVVDPA